jgi:hypothetical protein
MPRVSLERLEELLTKCESYLEYGCGGSTTLAAKLGVKNLIYCDTSNIWIDSVSKIVNTYSEINSYPVFVDLGEVIAWGRPKDQTKALSWKNYCYKPWVIAEKYNIKPQLILIDGRFRVACFLVSLLSGNIGTTILFDDYCDREYYQIIENIIKPSKTHDRLAEFIIPEKFDRNAGLIILLEYINNSN